jgi:hypothetical protein
MPETDTVLRSIQETGLATWFGGSLMGAVGLNGAAAEVDDPTERLEVASAGWDRWTPINAAAIGAFLVGSTALLMKEPRQAGDATMSSAKTALIIAALAATAYSRRLGRKLEEAGRVPVEGVTEPAPSTPPEVRRIQRRERVMQWMVPALTGALLAMTALGERQQRPGRVARGIIGRVRETLRRN